MKRTSIFAIAAAAASLVVNAQWVIAQDEPTELEGTWVVDSAIEQGAATGKPIGDKVTFAKNMVAIEPKDGQKPPVMTFSLDTAKTPKQITIVFMQGDQRQEVEGVYSVEGETLRLCLARPSSPRPTKLESQPDTMEFSLVLKRSPE